METLKDIFVPYDISVQLKEIGFDEPCIAGYFLCQGVYPMLDQMILKVGENNGNYDISAPTWEQVKKWFREKGIDSSLFTEDGHYYYRGSKGNKFLFSGTESSYEQAREQLIYKLIEIYKNEQDI